MGGMRIALAAVTKPGLAGAVLVLLAACAAVPGVRDNGDGTLAIQCSGGYHDWSRCHDRAARACRPGDYEIVSQVSNEGGAGVGTRDWSSDGSIVRRTLIARCLPPSP